MISAAKVMVCLGIVLVPVNIVIFIKTKDKRYLDSVIFWGFSTTMWLLNLIQEQRIDFLQKQNDSLWGFRARDV